jgi:glycosyltransferase involved in cell wall biosynthesis
MLFTGVISDLQKRVDILRSSDIFVLPSKVEGLSLAMLEAMSCGVPTIATDVGSDGEALRGAGIVLDPDALAGQLRLAIETLLEFPDFRRSLGASCRRRVEERYSLATNVQKVRSLYDAVVV